MIVGIVLSIVYLTAIIIFPFVSGQASASFNQWGDYFAGSVAPLAFIWFIATLHLHRKELSLQRCELELQREEMAASRAALEKQAEYLAISAKAMAETVRQANSESFRANVEEVRQRFRDILGEMVRFIPGTILTSPDGATKAHRPTSGEELKTWKKYLEMARSSEESLKLFEKSAKDLSRFHTYSHHYIRMFEQFRKGAYDTGNALYVMDDYGEIAGFLKVVSRYDEV